MIQFVQRVRNAIATATARGWHWLRPAVTSHGATGLLIDALRSRRALVAENALLRQQLIVLQRHVKRPKLTARARLAMVVLARFTSTWRDALLLVQPDTVLRWHRAGFRALWRRRTRTRTRVPRVPAGTVSLIERMARENRLWGAERIRGELRKFGIQLSKRTIQKHLRRIRPPRPSGQTWATFLRNHADDIWACDFLQTYDALFRAIFVFVIIEHGSRRIVHLAGHALTHDCLGRAADSRSNRLVQRTALPHPRQRRQV